MAPPREAAGEVLGNNAIQAQFRRENIRMNDVFLSEVSRGNSRRAEEMLDSEERDQPQPCSTIKTFEQLARRGNNESQVEFVPEKIRMDVKFLQAVRSGNISIAKGILSPKEGEARITIDASNGAPLQTSSLRGVTAGGNTPLHIVASYGNLDLVEEICSKQRSLLVACNQMEETPLHCAARAGHDQIVSHMISFAGDEEGGVGLKTKMLRAKKQGGKTALHEAAQNGHAKVAHELLLCDHRLADMVDDKGVSPLYMAVVSGSLALVQEFKKYRPPEAESTYYSGPEGQTALHAAILYNPRYLSRALINPVRVWLFQSRFSGCSSGREIAEELLQWKRGLEKKADNSGATPLHYAASVGKSKIAKLLLDHDCSLAYIRDSNGSYPIHVAAIMGRIKTINELISKCPDSYELLDARRRNFFHVAAKNRNKFLIFYFSNKPELSELMDAADDKGKTPLYMLAKDGRQRLLTIVDLRTRFNTMNFKYWKAPDWLHKYWVHRGGLPSPYLLHPDQQQRKNQNQNDSEDTKATEGGEGEQKLSRESLIVSSVLIATVTFSAAFSLPGGYKPDGTPTLATELAFKAFIIIDALAFVFSVVATFWLTFARKGKKKEIHRRGGRMFGEVLLSTMCLALAALLMVVAFAAGVYAVLDPVLHYHAIYICSFVMAAAISAPIVAAYDIARHLREYVTCILWH